jgi:hypothetical protein
MLRAGGFPDHPRPPALATEMVNKPFSADILLLPGGAFG